MKKVVLLILSVCSLSSFARNGENLISGRVLNEEKQGIPFASILLLNSSDSTLVKAALSDSLGGFVFDKIQDGNYRVSVVLTGYDKFYSPLIAAGENNRNIKLETISLKGSKILNEVTVTATRKFIEMQPGKIVVTPEYSPVNAGATALEVLKKSPGVTVDQDDHISLKGKQNVLVMIDDKPSYLTQEQLTSMLSNMPASSIGSIEIISNPPAKYDASGNAGIINIKMKKLNTTGYNGSVYAGAGYSWYEKFNGGLRLNKRTEKTNVFGNANYSYRKKGQINYLDRTVTFKNNSTLFHQTFEETSYNNYLNFKTGMDYFISSNTTLGFMVNGEIAPEVTHLDNRTAINGYNAETFSSLIAASRADNSFTMITGNANLVHAFDSTGKKISTDVDYSVFNSLNEGTFETRYYTNAGTETGTPYQFNTGSHSDVKLFAAKTDYEQPLKNGSKIEAGAKSSNVRIENGILIENKEGDLYVKDTSRSNDFSFRENINAAYLNFTGKMKKIELGAGLRMEHTNNSGKSEARQEVVSGNYVSLFPTLSLSGKINEKNSLSFSYSRRIDRPTYQDLNPFRFYADEYTYEQGNPFLKPQFTHGISLTYGYNDFLFFTLGSDLVNDYIAMNLSQNDSTKVTYISNTNYDHYFNYYLNLNTELPLTDWYSIQANLSGFYGDFHTEYNGRTVDNKRVTANVNLSNIFQFKKGTSVELSGHYTSPAVYGVFQVQPQYFASIGASQKLPGRMNVKVTLNDIFNTQGQTVSTNADGIKLTYSGKRETRRINFTFTYNFGKSTVKSARNRQTATQEEQGRIKKGN